jgi:DNA-binding NtrC family response regulator
VRHDWPGNVRELENLIERLLVLRGQGEVALADLPPALRAGGSALAASPAERLPQTGVAFHEVVDRFEADLIREALERTHWNKNQAARLLGLNRTTLLEKIKKKGLAPDA